MWDKEVNESMEYVKSNYPETFKRFLEIQRKQFELFCEKQLGYGPGNISAGQDLSTKVGKEVASTALIVRMRDKVERLFRMGLVSKIEVIEIFKKLSALDNYDGMQSHLMIKEAKPLLQTDPAGESKIDTADDLSVYGIIYQLVSEGVWGK